MKLSDRSNVEPFRAMEIVARAATLQADGEDVVMMCVGQPSAPAPLAAREAAMKAIEKGRIGYTPALGIAKLRQRISEHYRQTYAIEVDPERIVVTTGSSAGFMLAFIALFGERGRVAIPAPGYPAYRNILKALSLEPVELATTENSRWVLTPQNLEEAHNRQALDGVLIANPNNPNGTMMLPEAFRDLVRKADDLDVRFISDEIYHGLAYDVPQTTALAHTDKAIVINSFSKYYCMTGWRVGWMVVPEEMIGAVNRLQQNAFICAPEVSQIAALHAFDGVEELEAVKAGYRENRSYLLEALPQLGFTSIHPVDGAFYVYASVSGLSNDSEAFCRDVLENTKTAITPGTDFDPARGRAWARFSFAGSDAEMRKGIERLGNYLKG